jgi:hypothetical protein
LLWITVILLTSCGYNHVTCRGALLYYWQVPEQLTWLYPQLVTNITVIHGKENDYIHNLARNTTVIHGKENGLPWITVILVTSCGYNHVTFCGSVILLTSWGYNYVVCCGSLLYYWHVVDIIMLLAVDHCYITDKLWI